MKSSVVYTAILFTHVCNIWDNDLTEYQVWYKLTELWKAFRLVLTANRKKTLQRIFSYNSGRKRSFERFSCPEFVFEKSKHREAGLKHKLKLEAWRLRIFRDTLLLVFLNENCRLYVSFTELYLFYWLLVLSLAILIVVPIVFSRSIQ